MGKRIHILFPWNDGRGGGAAFLRSLRDEWRRTGVYAETAREADAILFNSHNNIRAVMMNKIMYPHKVFVHRVDGPMSVYTGRRDIRDRRVRRANQWLASKTVFQSAWSRQKNEALELTDRRHPVMVIWNAPDPVKFFKKESLIHSPVRLIAVSWSEHPNKGFSTLQWVDHHLDWSRYTMTYIGRSPISFAHIRQVPVLDSAELGEALRQHDILIFPSRFEACSNVLLEALHCGLPALAWQGSSNPELIGAGGQTFTREGDIPDLLQMIESQYQQHVSNIHVPSLREVAARYETFALGRI